MLGAFDESVRAALDIWTTDNSKPTSRFEDAERFRHLVGTPRMNLQALDMSPDDPMNFEMNVLVESFDQMRDGTRTIGEYPDRQYVTQHVVQHYLHARDTQHPKIDRIAAHMRHQYVVYDRIILPQRNQNGRSEWAISISLPEINIPAPITPPVLSERDRDILNLLVMGDATKEIAHKLGLSPKSVEHRLAGLRRQYNAKSLSHLAGIAVVTALTR